MISVINRRLPLNGNNGVLLLLLLLLISSCGIFGDFADSGKKPHKPDVKKRTDTEKRGEDYRKDLDTLKVDMVENPGKILDEDLILESEYGKFKSEYLIEFMLPVVDDVISEEDGRLSSANERYIEYYLGASIAAEQLASRDLKLKIIATDISPKSSKSALENSLYNNRRTQPDVIVGGGSREQIEALSAYAKSNKELVVSPFVPHRVNSNNNDYFIQLSPPLEAYIEAIVDDIYAKHNSRNVFLIAQNEFATRVESLQQYREENYKDNTVWKQFMFETETDVDALLASDFAMPENQTIFIIPMDYNPVFIYHVLTKIFSLKGSKDFIVYGLPPWDRFNILYEFYENMEFYIPSMNVVDKEGEKYSEFIKLYYKKYQAIPGTYAAKGYDEMMFIGSMLENAGVPFTKALPEITYNGISCKLRFEKAGHNPKVSKSYDYMENRGLRMWKLSP